MKKSRGYTQHDILDWTWEQKKDIIEKLVKSKSSLWF